MQSLETRRLMVAENAVFNVSESVSAAGLLGDVSAQVDWGDGTISNATTSGGSATGNLSVDFSYSLDDHQFFNQPGAKAALQFAAATFVSRFSDQFTAIGTNQYVTVRPQVFDPVTGQPITLAANPSIAANKIVIYAGSRNLQGNTAAVGGPGGMSLESSFTYSTPAEKARIEAEIALFTDSVLKRGQSGATGNPSTATDYAVAVGSIAFDQRSTRNWYFGIDPDGIGPGQTDFITIATHELAHVFGFGLADSWKRLSSSNGFSGAAAKAIYPGSGNVPLIQDSAGGFSHWSNAVDDTIATIMSATVDAGGRNLFSPLDFAAMDDIGYQLVDMNTTVTASHRYPDDGTYSTRLILAGSQGGQLEYSLNSAVVTNVAPTLTVASDRSVTVGQTISITNIGRITDPGFRNPNADPATSETFTYSVQWGDGETDTGSATIDRHGSAAPQTTNASFNGSHVYDSPGVKTVRVTVTDDDGGTDTDTFRITVNPIPELSISVTNATISEDAGNAATTLTVSVSGPAPEQAIQISLVSSDPSEATVPATITIPAGSISLSVPVNAIDDTLLDGEQSLTVTASRADYVSANAEIVVKDAENILAAVSADSVVEGSSGDVSVTLSRSNSDIGQAQEVLISGDRSNAGLATVIEIPAGQPSITIPLSPADDDIHELTEMLRVVFQATGYQGSEIEVDLLDDEPPLFQNQVDRFDVIGMDGPTELDALIIINTIASRSTNQLDPATQTPNGRFVDVNGDYLVTALDALQTINQIARIRASQNQALTGEIFVAPIQHDSLEDDEKDLATDAAIATMF